MADGLVHGTDAWEELLTATRHALSILHAEELEGLATHAETMFEGAAPRGTERDRLRKGHSLLGDLLSATDQNLQVLRRVCARKSADLAVEEGHRTWAR